MVKIYCITTLLFVLNYLPVWTSPRLGRRKPCLLRGVRGALLLKPFRKSRQSDILSSLPNLKVGPKRTKHYNPSYGYEVYWEGGNWIFDPPEPKEGDMCGARCNPVFKNYGPVCGRNKHFEHQSFETYCAMRDIDCNGSQGWLIAYRGECQEELRTYPTAAKQIVTRAMKWLDNFSEKYYG